MLIDLQSNISEAVGWLRTIRNEQLPFATSLALNRTAGLIRTDASARSSAALTAKPFTTGTNAFFIKSSNKNYLTAHIGYKDIQLRYMKWLLGGGDRVAKGFEVKLRSMGLLAAGYVTVPAQIKLDRYGNISKSTLSTILAQLASGMKVFSGRGKRLHADAVFVVKQGDRSRLHPGIWQRIERGTGSNILPLILFVPSARYRAGKFFDFQGGGKVVAHKEFPAQMRKALDEAEASAR